MEWDRADENNESRIGWGRKSGKDFRKRRSDFKIPRHIFFVVEHITFYLLLLKYNN